jgi:hypothetical protein
MDVNYMMAAENRAGLKRHRDRLSGRRIMFKMFQENWLWAVFTVAAALAQTLRNATQRELTGTLGTVGATHIRFLFGFPFALIFLALVAATSGVACPRPRSTMCPGSSPAPSRKFSPRP